VDFIFHLVAVGTIITDRPPHRTVRAALPHTATIARPTDTLSTLQATSRDASRKTRGHDGVAVSLLVGLFHSLQHAGLSRRTLTNANRTVPFTEEQVADILSACDKYEIEYERLCTRERLLGLIDLMLHTGLRIGDAAMFHKKWITKNEDEYVFTLRTTKTGLRVAMLIKPSVAETLLKLDGDHTFWNGVNDAETTAVTWRRALMKVLELAGAPDATPHQFKHTFAKRLLMKNVPVEIVSRLLGHRRQTTTEESYSRGIPEKQAPLDEAVKMAW
jgi:integrase